MTSCLSAQAPSGKYYCDNSTQCLPGFTCYDSYCCQIDHATGLCVDHPCLVNGADEDKDGVPVCAGDCDDHDPAVYPGAPEICDGKDNNCNGQVDEGLGKTEYRDSDGDGYGDPKSPVVVCASSAGLVENKNDCDDTDPTVHPGAPEICDGKDNDCDGIVDNNATSWFKDNDGDGYGGSTVITACERPAGYAPVGGDCDDTSDAIHPGAPEICDGKDNDCNGQIDEGVKIPIWPDKDADGYGDVKAQATPGCAAGVNQSTNNLDCDDTRADVNPGVGEICDGRDNNCNGQIDEGVTTTWFPDADKDGYGAKTGGVAACNAPAGTVANNSDCDDTRSAVHPGAAEVCDGLDNNCNGVVDEGLTVQYFRDSDCDGYGDPARPVVQCPATQGACTPGGSYLVENPLDCNDADPAVWPGAPEVCDGKDNNCDGVKDNDPTCGPRSDQTEVPALWSAGYASMAAYPFPPGPCFANSSWSASMPVSADATALGDGGTAIAATDTSTRDFFLVYPGQRAAGWDLTMQKLRMTVAGDAGVWSAGYNPVFVMFCSQNGAWARYDPAQPGLSGAFTPVVVNIPQGPGAFTYSAAPAFSWTKVDWVEVHANNGGTGTATLWLDDFRTLPQ